MLRRTARRAFAVDTATPSPSERVLVGEGAGRASAREQAVQRFHDALVETLRSRVQDVSVRLSGPRPGPRGSELLLEGEKDTVGVIHTLRGFLLVEQGSGDRRPAVEILTVQRQGGEYRPARKGLGAPASCPEGTSSKTPFRFTSVPEVADDLLHRVRSPRGEQDDV